MSTGHVGEVALREAPPDRTIAASRRIGTTGLPLLAGLALLVLASVALRPGQWPDEARLQADGFSLDRARAHLAAIASQPHPVGTPAHAAVMSYVREQLAALPIETSVQETPHVTRTRAGIYDIVDVRNVIAKIPGRASTGAVLLVAHYDSAIASLGAGDNGVGVSVLLETARVLAQSPRLANDVMFLFADAEEVGLRGAKVFVTDHPWAKDVRAVLNFEGRGGAGPSLMFQAINDARPLVDAMAMSGTGAAASSLLPWLYWLLPMDTDLTAFHPTGAAGLNFAFAERWWTYHTVLDAPAQIEPTTIAAHAEHALRLARAIATKLPEQRFNTPPIYFGVPGRLVVYSASSAPRIAAILVLIALGTIAAGLRARRVRIGGTIAALFLPLPLLIIAFVGSRMLLGWLYGGSRSATMPVQAALYLPGLICLATALSLAFYAAMARWMSVFNVTAAIVMWWSLFAVVSARSAPGTSYLFAAGLFGATGVLAWRLFAARDDDARDMTIAGALICLALMTPAVWLLSQAVYVLFVAFTREMAALAVVGFTLALTLAAPQFASLSFPRAWRVAAVLIAAGVTCLGLAVARSAPGRTQPTQNHMFYVYDHERGTAAWANLAWLSDSWSRRILATGGARGESPLFPARFKIFEGANFHSATAPPHLVEAPAVALDGESASDGVSTITFTVRSLRLAPEVLICLDSDAPIRSLKVDASELPVAPVAPAGGVAGAGVASKPMTSACVHYRALAGRAFQLRMQTQGRAPITVAMMDKDYTLPLPPSLPRAIGTRPDDTIPARSLGDASFAYRSLIF